MYTLAKIITNAYDELNYFFWDAKKNKIVELPIIRDNIINRRVYVSDTEKEMSSFDDTGDGALVERYCIPEDIQFIHTKNTLSKEDNYYEYDVINNCYNKVNKKGLKQRIATKLKQNRIVKQLCNIKPYELPDNLAISSGDWYLYKVDYIKTSDKVYYLSDGHWEIIPPEKIFYHIEGINTRKAYSYLPLPTNSYIKIVRKQFDCKQFDCSCDNYTIVNEFYHLYNKVNGAIPYANVDVVANYAHKDLLEINNLAAVFSTDKLKELK